MFCAGSDGDADGGGDGYFRPLGQRELPENEGPNAEISERRSPFQGVRETDESYFGLMCKRERGASGKTIVFGLLKRDNEVYTEIAPPGSKASLRDVIRGKASPESVLHTDCWRSYDGLVDLGFDKHFRVNHSDNEFAQGSNPVHGIGIESFWSFAKRRLVSSTESRNTFICTSKRLNSAWS